MQICIGTKIAVPGEATMTLQGEAPRNGEPESRPSQELRENMSA